MTNKEFENIKIGDFVGDGLYAEEIYIVAKKIL